MGSLAEIRSPDAVIIDNAGDEYFSPGEPYRLGQKLERKPFLSPRNMFNWIIAAIPHRR